MGLGLGMAMDEPIEAHQLLWGLDEPNLHEMLYAFALYARTQCSVSKVRMQEIEAMIAKRSFQHDPR